MRGIKLAGNHACMYFVCLESHSVVVDASQNTHTHTLSISWCSAAMGSRSQTELDFSELQ